MVLAESVARGLPCISNDCASGPEDIVLNGINGWLVPVGDIASLAAAMQNVIDRLEALPSAESVRETAARFQAENVVNNMLAAMGSEHPIR
jgi:UDP-D-galactose:(glucosyl)LPS alpha-1,6-D-galactosyltransferase